MEKGYLKVIEELGNIIISKNTEISLLNYELKKLEDKIQSVEERLDFYKKSCEYVNK